MKTILIQREPKERKEIKIILILKSKESPSAGFCGLFSLCWRGRRTLVPSRGAAAAAAAAWAAVIHAGRRWGGGAGGSERGCGSAGD